RSRTEPRVSAGNECLAPLQPTGPTIRLLAVICLRNDVFVEARFRLVLFWWRNLCVAVHGILKRKLIFLRHIMTSITAHMDARTKRALGVFRSPAIAFFFECFDEFVFIHLRPARDIKFLGLVIQVLFRSVGVNATCSLAVGVLPTGTLIV